MWGAGQQARGGTAGPVGSGAAPSGSQPWGLCPHLRRLNLVVALRRDESGQDLAEYALLVALIALVVVVAVSLTGQTISEFFVDAAQQIGGGEGKGTCCD